MYPCFREYIAAKYPRVYKAIQKLSPKDEDLVDDIMSELIARLKDQGYDGTPVRMGEEVEHLLNDAEDFLSKHNI